MRFEADGWNFGARNVPASLTFIPADQPIRPLRDRLVVEVLDEVASRVLIVPTRGRPRRGRVLAIGKGCYLKGYDHPEKHRRTKMWETNKFRPVSVKVGDIVDVGEFAFEGFYWGDRYCLMPREEDVVGVVAEEPAA